MQATVPPFEGCHLIQARALHAGRIHVLPVTSQRQGALKKYAESCEKYSTVYRKYELKALISCPTVEIVHCKSSRRQDCQVYS